ncbi:MAG: four helix bundle protein [Bacteroidota bacterium]
MSKKVYSISLCYSFFPPKTLRYISIDKKTFQVTCANNGLWANFLEQCIEAQYSPKNQKLPLLRKLNITLTKIRFYFRQGQDMNLYAQGHIGVISQRVNDIDRRIGAWIKAVSE